MKIMEDHPLEQWEDSAVGEGDLKITVHQGVGVHILEEEAGLSHSKPEGEVVRIVVAQVVEVRLARTRMMMEGCKYHLCKNFN